jgi:hypothetical protein
VQLPDTPQPKRSSHVALLVMGTLAVGGGAYALLPRQTCEPPQPSPGMAAPAPPQPGVACTTRSSWSGSRSSGYSRTHWSFFGGGSSPSGSSAHGPESSSSGVVRGGFGSFAHAAGFGGSSSS